jgi:hypothetical protein
MKQQNGIGKKTFFGLIFCLLLTIFVSIGCGMIKDSYREYTEKSFNSSEWLGGDAVERGRMYGDLFTNRTLDGKSKEEVTALLGEPEKIITIENREVWLYRVEHQHQTPMKYFPVSFDTKRGAFAGRVKSGAVSLLVKA